MGHHALQDLSLNITRSTAKQAGVHMPPVHGKDKPLDPSKKPEHQPIPQPIPKPSLTSSISEEPRVHSNYDKIKAKQISKIQNVQVCKAPLPSFQLIQKKLIERSIKTLTKPHTVQKFKVQPKLKSPHQKSLSVPPDVTSHPREIAPQEIIAHDKCQQIPFPCQQIPYTDADSPYKEIPSYMIPTKSNENKFPPLPPDTSQQVPSKYLNTKIKSLSEIDAQYDPAIDLNSPYNEEAVEIEY